MFLFGPSGCCKSTTLRVLAGLEPIESGRISIGDVDVTHLPPRARDVAMVFQNYALYPNMTVAANMVFALRNAGMSRADTRRRVLEVADILELTDLLDRKPA
ncbi:ATP-binding cassette domain-containing protein, partial [Mycobacterium tuberculosis]|uniref:ATP-binding cassette domain-containing protein n=1 Tax=Mycobacterium tuberculosis TaxID=1773 RepID=UPI0021C61AE5